MSFSPLHLIAASVRRLLALGWDLFRLAVFSALFFGLMVLATYWVAGRYIRGRETLTPQLVGRTASAALEVLSEKERRADRLSLMLEARRPHPRAPEGVIIAQFPKAGTRIKASTAIRIVVSAGSATVTVPDLCGETEIAAGIRLRNLGLEVGHRTTVPMPRMAPGVLVAMDPPPGTGAPIGSRVNLLLSAGRPERAARMPNLDGLTLADARQILAPLGLVIAEERERIAVGVQADRIYRQYPAPGEQIDTSTRISVTYAPEHLESPDRLADPADNRPASGWIENEWIPDDTSVPSVSLDIDGEE